MSSSMFLPSGNIAGANYFGQTPTSPIYGQTTGQNQYGVTPSAGPSVPMPSSTASPASPGSSTFQNWFTNLPQDTNTAAGQQTPTNEQSYFLGKGQYEVPPSDPALTDTLMNWLQGQVGTGITPYGGSTPLPTGGTTTPGATSAPLDPVTQALMQFYTTGNTGGNSALSSLQSLAATGNPINTTPEWQAMLAANQQQINQGAANTREALSFTGNLPGSAGALGVSEYNEQAALNNSALIDQLTTQAQQQAVQNQLTASQGLASNEQQLGSSLYGYDTNAVNEALQNYYATTPQENPLNSEIFSGATTYPPTYGKSSTSGTLGSILSGAGAAASGISGGLAAAGGGSGLLASILAGLGSI